MINSSNRRSYSCHPCRIFVKPGKLSKKSKASFQGFTLTIGKPLPNYGTCKHYAKSKRWLRFPCCKMAFPCDLCHESRSSRSQLFVLQNLPSFKLTPLSSSSDCASASEGVFATQMICGECSKEQPFSNNPCNHCKGTMGQGRSYRHWEGGKGCRNTQTMDARDAKKYRGRNKTVSRRAIRHAQTGKKKKK